MPDAQTFPQFADLTNLRPIGAMAWPMRVVMHRAPAPDGVLPTRMSDQAFVGVRGATGRPGRIIDDVADTGILGDARAADAAQGARLLHSAATNVAPVPAEVLAADHRRTI